MAKVSLSQAAKDTGVSLPTLSRWRKNGKITAEKNESGGYLIDTSEYDRINDVKKSTPNMKGVNNSRNKSNATHNTLQHERGALQVEVEILREKLKLKNLELEIKDKEINLLSETADDLKEQRNSWQKQAETLLLKKPDSDIEVQGNILAEAKQHDKPRKKPIEKKKGLWGSLFG